MPLTDIFVFANIEKSARRFVNGTLHSSIAIAQGILLIILVQSKGMRDDKNSNLKLKVEQTIAHMWFCTLEILTEKRLL